MAIRSRLVAVLGLLALLVGIAGGCDRDESASNQPAAQPPQPADSADGEGDTDAGETDDADAETPTPSPPKAAVPTPDVPIPPTVEGDVVKLGFVIFVAKDKPKNLADFYQKGMEAKGWKLGRNKTTAEIANLTNVVQEYTKGNELVTVLLQEQAGTDLTAGQVMDIPLPPNVERAVPVAGMVTMDVPGGSDEVLAWYNKALSPRGWSPDKTQDQQGLKAQHFRKGNRTLTVMARQFPGHKNSSVQVQHIAYAE